MQQPLASDAWLRHITKYVQVLRTASVREACSTLVSTCAIAVHVAEGSDADSVQPVSCRRSEGDASGLELARDPGDARGVAGLCDLLLRA